MPKISLLLNENIGVKTANLLRSKGYDVKSSIEKFRGVSDKEILDIAVKENRIIVTLDLDFCQLVFRDALACRGVILLRLRNESPKNINKVLVSFLRSRKNNLRDKFVVLTEIRARIRPIKK